MCTSILIFLVYLFPQASLAFDDDSTDDSRSLLEIRIICENGRTVIDTEFIRSSCEGDTVYLNQLRTGLFKNGVEIVHKEILDFKVARNGNLFYRTKIGPFLYNEKKRLNSNGSVVTLFLVSSSGDVVYLNDRGDIFKNGKELNRGPARVPVFWSEGVFLDRKIKRVANPLISRNGKAVYLNEARQLFVDGKRINPLVSNVVAIKLNSKGDVYFLDDNQRIYKNSRKLFDGRFRVLEFQISNRGQVAYLTDTAANNLFLENKVMSAGAHRVTGFSFDSLGNILYQDDLGRLWKNGELLGY